jgi:hypothetical protein
MIYLTGQIVRYINQSNRVGIVLLWLRISWVVACLFSFFFRLDDAYANFLFGSIRKVAVFPARGVDENLIDDLWWQLREIIAQDGRFEVATRRLMINRQVLSPRSELKSADAVIMGRILEADLLITHQVLKKKAVFTATRTSDGIIVWKEEAMLNPSIPESDQLLPVFKNLAKDFLKAVPYVGYQSLDPNNQKLYESDGGLGFVFVTVSNGESLLNQKFYWLNVSYPSQPLLKSRGNFLVLNWGRAVEFIKPNILKIKLEKPFDESYMSNGAPVYLSLSAPDSNEEPLFGTKISEIGSEYLISDMKNEKRVTEQTGKSTLLGFIFNAAILLLVAL